MTDLLNGRHYSAADHHQNHNTRVVVAMSGGVDSSVAAALLVEQGYDVVGLMMRLWSEPGAGPDAPANRCCTLDQMTDARCVADKLNIPFYVIDVQDHFRRNVVQLFIDQHEAGLTPNPCIACNRQIRFTYLLQRALALNAQFLATGHYARVRQTAAGYQLHKAIDDAKDQSYVLHVLGQEQLAHVMFPIGEYSKEQVRDLAHKMGLTVAAKKESQDLCFLKDGDYRRFLSDYSLRVFNPGPILDTNGRELGQHQGLPHYTIGQRKGLGISTPEPVFVIAKDTPRNALIVGERSLLDQRELVAHDVNWVNGTPETAVPAQVKIRYKATPVAAEVQPLEDGRAAVHFLEPVYGITPGQGAVFYDGDVCLGGGIIQ